MGECAKSASNVAKQDSLDSPQCLLALPDVKNKDYVRPMTKSHPSPKASHMRRQPPLPPPPPPRPPSEAHTGKKSAHAPSLQLAIVQPPVPAPTHGSAPSLQLAINQTPGTAQEVFQCGKVSRMKFMEPRMERVS